MMAALTGMDEQMFMRAGCDLEIVRRAGVERVTPEEAFDVYGIRLESEGGICFPYFSPPNGNPRQRLTARIRQDGRTERKYLSPYGDRRHLYIPPVNPAWLLNPKTPVMLVEAEKSSLAITGWAERHNFPIIAIALGGCWGWRGRVGIMVNPDGERVEEKGPLAELDLCDNRMVYVTYDRNITKNNQVYVAREKVIEELHRRKADVFLIDLPILPNEKVPINGPDDFLGAYGDEEFFRLFHSVEHRTRFESGWPDPSELGDELPPVEPFACEVLPESFRPLVEDVSERTQTPMDYAAAAAIVSLAGCVNRRATMQPKAEDTSWLVIPNLWGAVIAPPGFMKSPVQRLMTRPLAMIEEAWREEYEREKESYGLEKKQSELASQVWAEQTKAAMKKGTSQPQPPAKVGKPPTQKRLILTSATFEKLHEILAENPAGVLVLRDELTGWLSELDKMGREGERAFYLQSWNGDTGFTVDRIGRGSIHVPAACVSLLGNIQPARLRWYLSDAIQGGGPNDDGLFQRYQIVVWPDAPRDWKLVDRTPNNYAEAGAAKVFTVLANLSSESPVRMRFDPDGQQLFFEWLSELEGRVRGECGLHPAMVAHLAKYRSLMPSLAALFELADRAADGKVLDKVTVSLEHAKQAAAFCEYLESHARRVYACIVSPECRAARELAQHIQNGDLGNPFTTRDAHRKGWTGLDDPERVRRALASLEEDSWVHREETPKSQSGGRPSEVWQVNPKVVRREK